MSDDVGFSIQVMEINEKSIVLNIAVRCLGDNGYVMNHYDQVYLRKGQVFRLLDNQDHDYVEGSLGSVVTSIYMKRYSTPIE